MRQSAFLPQDLGQNARLIQKREKQNEKCTKSEETGRDTQRRRTHNAEEETWVNAVGWSRLLQKWETKPDTVANT